MVNVFSSHRDVDATLTSRIYDGSMAVPPVAGAISPPVCHDREHAMPNLVVALKRGVEMNSQTVLEATKV